MFPKNRRIPRKMFPLLTNGSHTFKNKLFLLKFVRSNEQNPPASQAKALRAGSRFSFSVSKKVAKSAVVRNRLRRTGYRLLQRYLPKIKSKVLAVFYFRVVPKDNDDIIKNLESILNDSLL